MLCVPARGEIPARSHCPPAGAAAATPPTRRSQQTRGSNKFGVGLNYSFIPHAAAGETKTRDKKRTRFLLFAPRHARTGFVPNLMALLVAKHGRSVLMLLFTALRRFALN
jgi:hypothetical protein